MSDTPRTDMAWKTLPSVYDFIVEMKRMERELNAANNRIKRLEEAGDAVAAIIGPPGSALWADENEVDAAWNKWTKANEAKP